MARRASFSLGNAGVSSSFHRFSWLFIVFSKAFSTVRCVSHTRLLSARWPSRPIVAGALLLGHVDLHVGAPVAGRRRGDDPREHHGGDDERAHLWSQLGERLRELCEAQLGPLLLAVALLHPPRHSRRSSSQQTRRPKGP